MDSGEVPDELQNLIEIEEMLIARVFPIILIYRLRGGQHGYRGNVINFPQNVRRTCHKSSSTSIILSYVVTLQVIRKHLDLRIRRDKVNRALNWLKENNRYYTDIITDHEVLRILPIN